MNRKKSRRSKIQRKELIGTQDIVFLPNHQKKDQQKEDMKLGLKILKNNKMKP
jgi:hypothetical protein